MNRPVDVIVLSRQGVEEFYTDRPYILISIRDPQSKPANVPKNPNEVARLDLEFSDWDLDRFPALKGQGELKAFVKEDADSILTLIRLTLPYINLLVVNCEAGISRSAGTAAAVAKILGQKDDIYFKNYIPNRYIYKLLLNTYMDSKPIGD